MVERENPVLPVSQQCRLLAVSRSAHDGSQLGAVLDRDNTASDVWADTAYRLAANLALLDHRGLKPQFQRKKPRGRKMPPHIAKLGRLRVDMVELGRRTLTAVISDAYAPARAHGTTSSIPARNLSRRVGFFLRAHSACKKLRCRCINPPSVPPGPDNSTRSGR
jgi:hypothetical protein